MTCYKARTLVKKTAGQRLNPDRPGELPTTPRGYRCTAYGNSHNVQTYGNCRAKASSKYFDWSMIH